MGIGTNIKQARINAGLTQKDLAELIGVKHNSISDWENERTEPNVDGISALCEVLKIAPDVLLGITGERFTVSEQTHIKKYRKLDAHGQKVVDFLIDEELARIECETTDTVRVFKAARSSDDTEPGMVEIPRSTIDKLKAAKPAEKI